MGISESRFWDAWNFIEKKDRPRVPKSEIVRLAKDLVNDGESWAEDVRLASETLSTVPADLIPSLGLSRKKWKALAGDRCGIEIEPQHVRERLFMLHTKGRQAVEAEVAAELRQRLQTAEDAEALPDDPAGEAAWAAWSKKSGGDHDAILNKYENQGYF